MSAIVLKHLDAIAASMTLLNAQLAAARHAIAIEVPIPSARPSLHARCAGVSTEVCALQDGEWNRAKANFGDPNLVQCVGCGYTCSGGTGE